MNEFKVAGSDEGKENMKRKEQFVAILRKQPRTFSLLALCGGLFLSGCSGGGTNATSSSTPTGTVNTYQGVSNVTTTAGVLYVPFWTFTLEGTENSFSYDSSFDALSELPQYDTGTYSSDGQYLALTSQIAQGANGPAFQLANAGYALTIPGEAALLRPGNTATPPVVTAGMTSCPVVSSAETFLFIVLPGSYWNAASSAAYGSVQATTDSTGGTWKFTNQNQSLLSGNGMPPQYPASFSATCGQGTTGYSIGVLPTPTSPYYDPQISISPNGFFTEETTGSPLGATTLILPSEVQQPFVGFAAPTAAVNTNSLVAAKYLGFEYEFVTTPGQSSAATSTQLVSFGPAASGSGTTLTGGAFPKDDPTQTPAANITVNFGTQSATQNGLYPSVTVTEPDTTETQTGVNHCTNGGGTSGGTTGSLMCSFKAVAIAGNPKNNFAIFLIGLDPIQGGAPFNLYLYQQQ